MRERGAALAIALLLATIGCTAPVQTVAPPTGNETGNQTESPSSPTGVAPSDAPTGSPPPGPTATGSTESPTASDPPAPAATLPPLPDSADLAPLPTPAALADGVAQQQAQALVAALAEADSADERLPLVMTALLASGIPIIGDDGQPVPFDPAPVGPALQAWQVHALAAVDPTRHARMTVDDVLGLFMEEPTPADAEGFRHALSLDIRTAAFGADPQGQLWGWIVSARDPRGATLAMAAGETENLDLDGLQLELLLARLTVDFWRVANEESGGSGTVVAARLAPAPWGHQAPQAARRHCTYSETEETIVTVAEGLGSTAMGQVIDFLADKDVAGMDALGKVGMGASIMQFIAPYLLLTIEFELSSPPLVRTKATGQDGERRQLAATLRFDTGNAQLVNCFRLLFASLGMTFSLPADGPLGNGSVSWEPRHGFERVQFYGDPVHSGTDDKGISIIGIEGRRQKATVPQTAGRVNTDASVFLAYAVKSTSLGGDLLDAISTTGGPLSIALESLSRIKWSSATFIFDVVDWGERWQAEIVIDERTETGSMYVSWTGVLGVDSEGIVVGEGVGTLALITNLCTDIGPDRHSEAIDWRVDADFTFRFDGYKENDVLHMLLPTDDTNFRQSGDPGPCGIAAAFHWAQMETLLAQMKDFPIQLGAQAGTKSIPMNEGVTMTIRLEPVSD